MKAFVVASLAVVALAAPASADGPRASGAYAPQRAPAAQRPIRRHHSYQSALYRFYPPTVMRDGRSYFYYPGRGEVDQPVHPFNEMEPRDRRHRLWR